MTDRVLLQITDAWGRYSIPRRDFCQLEVTPEHEVVIFLHEDEFPLATCDSAEEARALETRLLHDIWNPEGYGVVDLDRIVEFHLGYLRSTCSTCNGDGEVMDPSPDAVQTCPDCRGTGRDETL